MFTEIKTVHDFLVIKPTQETLDATNSSFVKTEVIKSIEENFLCNKIIMDFSDIYFMDSTGVTTVISLYKLFGHQKKIAFCGARKEILHVLELTNMTNFIKNHKTLQDAIVYEKG